MAGGRVFLERTSDGIVLRGPRALGSAIARLGGGDGAFPGAKLARA